MRDSLNSSAHGDKDELDEDELGMVYQEQTVEARQMAGLQQEKEGKGMV